MLTENKRPPRERAAVFFMGFALLANVIGGCEQSAAGGKSAFVEGCIGTDMSRDICSCMDEAAQSSLDDALYGKLVGAAQSAAAAREAGSEDGMMDHLPEDLSDEDSSKLVLLIMSVRTRCMPQ